MRELEYLPGMHRQHKQRSTLFRFAFSNVKMLWMFFLNALCLVTRLTLISFSMPGVHRIILRCTLD